MNFVTAHLVTEVPELRTCMAPHRHTLVIVAQGSQALVEQLQLSIEFSLSCTSKFLSVYEVTQNYVFHPFYE